MHAVMEEKQSNRYESSLTEDGRYRLLVEGIRDYAIYMLDPNGNVTSWNPGATRFKGYEPGEIVGQHFSRFYTEEDRQAGLPEKALDIATREGVFEGEGWRVRKDGSRFWAHVLIDPIITNAGELIGFAKVTRDLTERKEAQAAIRQSEEQFRLLVQSVIDYAIYMLDAGGHVSSWNPGAERLKGYTADEIIGQHYSRFYTEEERAEGIPDRNLRIAAAQGRFEKEGWRVRKDGTRFWASVVIDPIKHENGTVIGFAKVTRDFTERRKVQLELEQAREALFQSQKMEAVGKLTGGVAHDFNNLLMAILGSLEMARKRMRFDPKVAPLIENAILAGQRGANLTQRMLIFARREKLNPQAVDLLSLVRGMRELFQRSLGSETRIEMRFPLALPLVRIDPVRMETALLNLCLNARDAMPEGGLITISADEGTFESLTSARLRGVRLVISDTGTGMDENTLAQAIEPFFTTKGIGKGTGLGLSMVQGLIEHSDGRLAIRSKVGAGTTVEMWLPAASESPERAAPELAIEEPAPASSRSLVVLAVDDDPLVLLNTRMMLEDLGHTVVEAKSGAEALEVLTRIAQVDLVVTDQAMPNMTGLQLANLIKESWPDLPIIIATGYAEMPNGGTDLPKIGKPYFEGDLAKAIAEATKPQP
jgi:PAS domain S-box-containing protein